MQRKMEMYIRAFEVFGSSGFVHFHKLRYFVNLILKITIIFTWIAISEPNNALIPLKFVLWIVLSVIISLRLIFFRKALKKQTLNTAVVENLVLSQKLKMKYIKKYIYTLECTIYYPQYICISNLLLST